VDTLLDDFGITAEALRSEPIEDFLGKCLTLAEANVKDLYKLLESQGYDLWLQRICYPSHIIPEAANKRITIHALEKLKAFIEVEMCNESKGVMLLHPNGFRLMSKMGVVINETEEAAKPINYFNDSLIATNYTNGPFSESLTIT
jgi:hypothetical protein